MLLGILGTNEIIVLLFIVFPVSIFLIVRFIYRYGKNKGRLEELERMVEDSSKQE